MISAPGGDSAARRMRFSPAASLVMIRVREAELLLACLPVRRSCQAPVHPMQSLDRKRSRTAPGAAVRMRKEAGRPAGSDPCMSLALPASRGGTDQPDGVRGSGVGPAGVIGGSLVLLPAAVLLAFAAAAAVSALGDLVRRLVRKGPCVDVPATVLSFQGHDLDLATAMHSVGESALEAACAAWHAS